MTLEELIADELTAPSNSLRERLSACYPYHRCKCFQVGEIMFGVLGLGFLLGMQHALEADHIAAVSSIAARRRNVADIVKHGLTWGLGHTLTLFGFAGAAILLGRSILSASRGRSRQPSD